MPTLKHTKLELIVANALVIVSVLATGLFVFTQFYNSAKADTGACTATGKKYQLQLQNDTFSKPELTVNRCDSIAITNLDALPYELSFGEHDNHIAYPGYTAKILQQNETVVIVAQKSGPFELHDHIRDKAVIELTIK